MAVLAWPRASGAGLTFQAVAAWLLSLRPSPITLGESLVHLGSWRCQAHKGAHWQCQWPCPGLCEDGAGLCVEARGCSWHLGDVIP